MKKELEILLREIGDPTKVPVPSVPGRLLPWIAGLQKSAVKILATEGIVIEKPKPKGIRLKGGKTRIPPVDKSGKKPRRKK